MDNKGLLFTVTMILLSFILGVTITFKEVNSPLINRLITQQDKVQDLQNQILMKTSVAGQPSAGNLEGRLASIEQKLDKVVAVFEGFPGRNAQGQAQPQGGGCGGGAQAQQRPQMPPQDPEEYTRIHQIDIGKSPVKGPKNAKVTIVEFMDFQCPFCSRFHPVIAEVMKAYPTQVNLVIKNFPLPFHEQGRPAAKASFAAAEQGKYWEMVELILANNTSLSEEKFVELAQQLKLNVDKFKKDLKDRDAEWENRINEEMALGSKVGVQGTPMYYINGRKTMARDLATYKTEIDQILNKK